MNKIFLLRHQKEFIKSNAMHTGLIGGYGSGKTLAAIYKIIKFIFETKTDCAYYLPTYNLVEDVALKKMPKILNKLKIHYTMRKQPYNITFSNGSSLMLRSMDNPDMIAGYEVGYSVIDEIDRMPQKKAEEAFYSITARNRLPLKNQINSVDFVCTPEGHKFLYDFFIKKPSDNKFFIKGKTKDNPFLPAGYIKQLEETYSPQYLKAYLEGEFVNLTSGNVYNDFDIKENHFNKPYNSNDTLHIGMDFNITQMNAVVGIKDGDNTHIVEEIVNKYDTNSICEYIKHKFPNNRIIVYPDATGKNRNSSGKTDHEIIRSYGFTIVTKSTNPFVKDRVNEVNKSFRDKTVFINTINCPTLTEALQLQVYKNGEPDKTSGYDHINEAFGYLIYNSKNSVLKLSTSVWGAR